MGMTFSSDLALAFTLCHAVSGVVLRYTMRSTLLSRSVADRRKLMNVEKELRCTNSPRDDDDQRASDLPVPLEKNTVLRRRHLAGTEQVLHKTSSGRKQRPLYHLHAFHRPLYMELHHGELTNKGNGFHSMPHHSRQFADSDLDLFVMDSRQVLTSANFPVVHHKIRLCMYCRVTRLVGLNLLLTLFSHLAWAVGSHNRGPPAAGTPQIDFNKRF